MNVAFFLSYRLLAGLQYLLFLKYVMMKTSPFYDYSFKFNIIMMVLYLFLYVTGVLLNSKFQVVCFCYVYHVCSLERKGIH